jgi:hypothetical protein
MLYFLNVILLYFFGCNILYQGLCHISLSNVIYPGRCYILYLVDIILSTNTKNILYLVDIIYYQQILKIYLFYSLTI